MNIEDTKLTAEARSVSELNQYLNTGWVLILSYVKHVTDNQQPHFVIGWQKNGEPVFPEFLDEWERNEIKKNRNR